MGKEQLLKNFKNEINEHFYFFIFLFFCENEIYKHYLLSMFDDDEFK